MIFQFGNHIRISVRVKEAKCEGQPSPAGSDCQDVEQENEQIIRVPRRRRERFVVHDLKVNQPRPASLLVVNNVGHSGVAVRPAAAKFIAPELMRAEKLAASRLQHRPSQGATVHVFPKVFPREFVGADRLCCRRINPKTVAIQHLKTLRFPAPPVFCFAPKTDWYVRHAKIQIGQIGQLVTVDLTVFKHDLPSATDLLGDRAEL
ncbi:MAG: hypothetical protein DME60_07685 [Verrucomicrobia bacterium]|nr:MAG: hypothetical protein DME60_07685 [Verrucomicrobiota bacterium]